MYCLALWRRNATHVQIQIRGRVLGLFDPEYSSPIIRKRQHVEGKCVH